MENILKKKNTCHFPEINNSSSVFPVRKNRKRPEIINDFLFTYQIDKAMTYEPPIKNYTYPYSTNSEIGWPWCDDNSIEELNKSTSQNKIFDFLTKCQCEDVNLSTVNNENKNDNIVNNSNDTTTHDIGINDTEDNSVNAQNFLKTEKLINKLQKHGSSQYRLRNPMRWWGGCIESLP